MGAHLSSHELTASSAYERYVRFRFRGQMTIKPLDTLAATHLQQMSQTFGIWRAYKRGERTFLFLHFPHLIPRSQLSIKTKAGNYVRDSKRKWEERTRSDLCQQRRTNWSTRGVKSTVWDCSWIESHNVHNAHKRAVQWPLSSWVGSKEALSCPMNAPNLELAARLLSLHVEELLSLNKYNLPSNLKNKRTPSAL